MFDQAGLSRHFSGGTQRKGGKKGDYPFPFLGTYMMEDGIYRMRILPRDPGKCPKGWWPYSKHEVETKVNQAAQPILCLKNLNRECPICDLYEALQGEEAPTDLKSRGLESVADIVNDLEVWNKYLVPVTVFVRETKTVKGDKTYTNVAPGDMEKGYKFEISASTKSLHDGLNRITSENPDLTYEDDRGSYVLFTKQKNRYDISLDPAGKKVPLCDMSILKTYPDFSKLGKFMDYVQIEALLKSCWWFQYVSQYLED